MSGTPVLGMRDAYFDALYDIFRGDDRAIFLTADNGAPALDRFARDFPGRYLNVGIAEQQLIGMACGLAFEGWKVYTYAIAPFVSLRCFEQNKLDVCAMNLPIVNIGVGAGYAYDIMGPSHHTVEDVSVMRTLPNLVIYSPADGLSAAALAHRIHQDPRPQYVRFDRSGLADLYTGRTVPTERGFATMRPGRDVTIVATGVMVHTALQVADALERTDDLSVGVIDLFRLKPIDDALLISALSGAPEIVTLEEHLLAGGMGSAIAEILVDHGSAKPLLRIGQNDRFVFEYGGREVIWQKYGLDAPAVAERIRRWRARGAQDAKRASAA